MAQYHFIDNETDKIGRNMRLTRLVYLALFTGILTFFASC